MREHCFKQVGRGVALVCTASWQLAAWLWHEFTRSFDEPDTHLATSVNPVTRSQSTSDALSLIASASVASRRLTLSRVSAISCAFRPSSSCVASSSLRAARSEASSVRHVSASRS